MAVSTARVVDFQSLAGLIPALEKRGYQVIGPQLRDGAVVLDRLSCIEDLPAGWTDLEEPGRYRLTNGGGALFAFRPGPQSWKKYLHPAEIRLFGADAPPRYAFFGVRPCDLSAIFIQDRVLAGDGFRDPLYQARRQGAFLIAVNCTQSAATCFCESTGSGPAAAGGYDLALTELPGAGGHEFLAEAATPQGSDVLSGLNGRKATSEDRSQAAGAISNASRQTRSVSLQGLANAFNESFDHPRWDQIAQRCMSCGNCTMVCPTCFCTTIEDTSAVDGSNPQRIRKWDSCFTLAFSYIHGGSVRSSSKSRYRQWLTHKFAYWQEQFGARGCVGCGRCITWCPAGIDITAELAALQATGTRGTQPAEH